MAAAACPIWAAWAFKPCPFKRTARNQRGRARAASFIMEKFLGRSLLNCSLLNCSLGKNVVGAEAVLDDGSAQPVNIQMVMDHLQQTKFLLGDVGIGSSHVTCQNIGRFT